jgi:hypothetical protein
METQRQGSDGDLQAPLPRVKQGNELLKLQLLAGLDSGEPVRLDNIIRKAMRQQVNDILAKQAANGS